MADDRVQLDYARHDKWVVVRSYGDAPSAHLARMQLERAGIPSYIENENVCQMLWYVQPTVGVQVRVQQECLADAQSVLDTPTPDMGDEEDDEPSESWRGGPSADGDDEDEDDNDENDVDADLRYEEDDDQKHEPTGSLRYADHEYDFEPDESCPKCHSQDVATISWAWRFAQTLVVVSLLVVPSLMLAYPGLLLLAILGAGYYLITKPRFRCTRCGHRFTPEP